MEIRKKISFLVILSLGWISFSAYGADPVREGRDRLLTLLEDARNRGQERAPDILDRAQGLLRGYRWQGWMMPVRDAPFLGLVFAQDFEGFLPGDRAAKPDALPLEPVFDFLVDGILADQLPPMLKEAGASIGKCLARKIARAREQSCSLVTDRPSSPGKLALLFHKLSCGISFPSPCSTRKTFFEALKVEFVDQLTEVARKLPETVNRKFGGPEEADLLWHAPLVEADVFKDRPRITLEDWGSGLRADVMAAEVLAQSEDSLKRGLAAPLFFAAANRLLILAGGQEARYSRRRFHLNEPAISQGRAPLFKTRTFGGWGGARVDGKFQFSPWELRSYDPAAPGAFRVFPEATVFAGASGWRGVPSLIEQQAPVQTLTGMSEVLLGVAEFLKATRAGVLSRYFGPASELGRSLVDPEVPQVFPMEGRLLAAGVGATVLKNLVAPIHGHLELLSPGSPDGGLGILFHEEVSLEGRVSGAPRVESVARVLLAINAFREAIEGDSSLPPELLDQVSRLDAALQVGSLVLRAQGQSPDGGFNDRLGNSGGTDADLQARMAASIWGLRALTDAFDVSQMSVLRLGIKEAWSFLDGNWESQVASLSEKMRWKALTLWSETQKTVRPALVSEMDWSRWETRFDELRKTQVLSKSLE